MWGRGPRGNNATCSALGRLSITSSTNKQIRPFWCWFPGGWAYGCSRTLWVSLTNSPVSEAGSFSTPTGIFQSEVLRLYCPMLKPWVALSVSLPSFSSQSIHRQMWDLPLGRPLPCHKSSVPWLPISTPPTSLDECFFFNSLVVGLLYSLIFWQFWLFFVFKCVVLLFIVWWGTVHLPTPPSWPEVWCVFHN